MIPLLLASALPKRLSFLAGNQVEENLKTLPVLFCSGIAIYYSITNDINKNGICLESRPFGMKTFNHNHYSYRVIWSEEDNEYVGLCTEFSSLSWLAGSPEEALRGIREVVAEVIEDMKKSGEPIPEPLSSKRFSGKFIVRVPPQVHRRLALEASESGVSLNRLVSARLSH